MKGLTLSKDEKSLHFTEIEESNFSGRVVHMYASALNRRDFYITKGLYPGIKSGRILGSDGSGHYKEEECILNPNINWGSNNRVQSAEYQVLGMPSHGTFADKVFIAEDRIHPMPEHLDPYHAAALPLAGTTAYRALFTQAQAKKGEKVLISGVGGGVALMAMLFALACGAEVYVSSSSPQKIERAKDLGAVDGVLYTEPEWYKKLLKISGGIDVVIDSAGGEGFKHFIPLCNPGARISIYGGTRGKITEINTQVLFWRQISIHGSTMGSDDDFHAMLEFVNTHKITPIIDTVYKLSEYEKGFDRMSRGEQFGKIVFDHKA